MWQLLTWRFCDGLVRACFGNTFDEGHSKLKNLNLEMSHRKRRFPLKSPCLQVSFHSIWSLGIYFPFFSSNSTTLSFILFLYQWYRIPKSVGCVVLEDGLPGSFVAET